MGAVVATACGSIYMLVVLIIIKKQTMKEINNEKQMLF